MNEAAQFAEAIGEVPPTDASVLPEIIEEDSSSSEYDEDQGATEIDGLLDDCDLSRGMRPSSPTRSLSALSQNLPPLSPLRQAKEKLSFSAPSPIRPAKKFPTSPLPQDEVPSMVIAKSPCKIAGPHLTQPQHENTPPQHTSAREQQRAVKSVADEAAGPDCSAEKPKPKIMKRPLWVSKPLSRSRSLSKSTECLLNRISHEGADKSESTYVYKGIRHNPPEVTKRGISRGNYAQLHRKAWLEVSDKYHRYGKNLRLYYKHWEKLGHPTNMFFDWIDSKGEAAGAPLPNLPECPRSQLDSDTVLYITNPEIQARYALTVDLDEDSVARILDVNGDPISTGQEGWIFVLRDHVLYGSQKVTSITGKSKQRFHHSSFFGGKAVAAAGIIITDEDGCLTRLYPHSGHYRPGEAHMQRMLYFLQQSGVDLNTFEVDMQQILHVSRKEATPKGGVLDEKDQAKLLEEGHLKKSKKS
uniref:Uncharacterized protein n=1 Tax=Helicotheca tamesis TaxID=374047 RepID=A0A7S2GW54_9STRA